MKAAATLFPLPLYWSIQHGSSFAGMRLHKFL